MAQEFTFLERAWARGMLLIAAAFISLGKPTGWDFFWYLGAGKLMHGGINEGVTFTTSGHSWQNHEWLFHWIMGFVPNPGIFHLVLHILLVFAVINALYQLLIRRFPNYPLLMSFLTIIAALLMSSFLILRAQLASYLFFILLLNIMTSRLTEFRKALWLIPLMLLWANMHGAFVLGVFMVILIQAIRYQTRDYEDESNALLIPVFVSIVIPLINPNLIDVYYYPFNWVENSIYKEYISEWTSVLRWDDLLLGYMGFTMFLVLALVIARTIRLRNIIPVIILGLLPLAAVRHLPFYYIYATPLIAESLVRIEEWLKVRMRGSIIVGSRKWILGLGLLVIVLAMNYQNNRIVRVTDPLFSKYTYPSGAVAFMNDNGLNGRLLNAYEWGGYLWYKGLNVFIDGRLDTYFPRDVFIDYTNIVTVQPEWQDELDKWKINFVLYDTLIDGQIPKLNRALMGSDEWITLYQDPVATLYGRVNELDPVFLAKWKDGLIPIPDDPMSLYAAGVNIVRRGGQYEQAINYLQKALELDPSFASPHVELADILIVEKKYGQARSHLRHAKRLGADSERVDKLWNETRLGD